MICMLSIFKICCALFKKIPKVLAALVNIGHFKKYSCTSCYYGRSVLYIPTGSFGRVCVQTFCILPAQRFYSLLRVDEYVSPMIVGVLTSLLHHVFFCVSSLCLFNV